MLKSNGTRFSQVVSMVGLGAFSMLVLTGAKCGKDDAPTELAPAPTQSEAPPSDAQLPCVLQEQMGSDCVREFWMGFAGKHQGTMLGHMIHYAVLNATSGAVPMVKGAEPGQLLMSTVEFELQYKKGVFGIDPLATPTLRPDQDKLINFAQAGVAPNFSDPVLQNLFAQMTFDYTFTDGHCDGLEDPTAPATATAFYAVKTKVDGTYYPQNLDVLLSAQDQDYGGFMSYVGANMPQRKLELINWLQSFQVTIDFDSFDQVVNSERCLTGG